MKTIEDVLRDAVETHGQDSGPTHRRVSTLSHGCTHERFGGYTVQGRFTFRWCAKCGAFGVRGVGFVQPGPDAEGKLLDIISRARELRK